ncbi:ATP-grasp enzyme [Williamsia sp. MIQD14]|uniref:ATP-grasp enzyme n=1 Tax=Williamsia sp. MIQD14 TaxID=3425703 RepID=UPI003DA12964
MTSLREADAARTLGVLAALTVTLPIDAAVVGVAWAAGRLRPGDTAHPSRRAQRKTVLVTGGKMTKSLALARAFHAAGHRVVLVESTKYRWTGHRFSRAVDAFHCTPEPTAPGYAEVLRDIVIAEDVDVVVPVSSPASSIHEAAAHTLLDAHCEVVHGDEKTVHMLDDKDEFSAHAASLGLAVPHFARITDPAQIDDFDFRPGSEYILKRIAYNPVGRMDLTRLRRETPRENAAFACSLGITRDDPWILQEFIDGTEYCTHGTVRDGRLQVYACCESSAFQINYAMVDKPDIRRWVETFLEPLDLTGQASFDFIEASDGTVYAIECNPRTHSAITMFYDHPDVAAAYLTDDQPTVVPTASSRPTHWIYHELWRLLTERGRRARLASIRRSTDAIFDRDDPLPFLMVHHLQIPSLLVRNLRARRGWSRIDFNIGKLVENGGD